MFGFMKKRHGDGCPERGRHGSHHCEHGGLRGRGHCLGHARHGGRLETFHAANDGPQAAASGMNRCPICDNHCPLSEPGCEKGAALAGRRNNGGKTV